MKQIPLMFLVLCLASTSAIADQKSYRIDGGKKKCTSSGGTEIKADGYAMPPPGKVWLDVQVDKKGWAPKELSCYPNFHETQIKANIGGHDVYIKGYSKVDMHMYADCGSGMGPVLAGNTISIECNLIVNEIDLP